MKKFILSLILIFAGALAVSAQVIDHGTSKDNWYVGGNVGTQVWNDQNSWTFDSWDSQMLLLNATVGKYFSPYLGAEADITGIFNNGSESKFIDGHNISGNIVLNLSNLVAGYSGNRHPFELEAISGFGWYHVYATGADDYNDLSFRGAVRANYNLSKSWAINLTGEYVSLPSISNSTFTMKPQGVNAYVGVTYRIPSTRSGFNVCTLYDYDEVARLNDKINALESELAKKPKQIVVNNPVTVTDIVANTYKLLFNQGSSELNGSVLDIATALNKTTGNIVITGYASPEGSESRNATLAAERAESVKKALIAAGVDGSRITTNSDYEDLRAAVVTLQ